VAVACGFTAGLMAVVAAWPTTMWPLEGTAVGLLARAAAWCVDEAAAAVVDTLPRGLRWRTTGRAVAAIPLAVVWVLCVYAARHHLPPHAPLFALQGIAALAFAFAFVTWRRARGRPTPGALFGSFVIPASALFALARPVPTLLPLFPIWPDDAWALSHMLWIAVTAGSVAGLVHLIHHE
jgi:hypothetical protein